MGYFPNPSIWHICIKACFADLHGGLSFKYEMIIFSAPCNCHHFLNMGYLCWNILQSPFGFRIPSIQYSHILSQIRPSFFMRLIDVTFVCSLANHINVSVVPCKVIKWLTCERDDTVFPGCYFVCLAALDQDPWRLIYVFAGGEGG